MTDTIEVSQIKPVVYSHTGQYRWLLPKTQPAAPVLAQALQGDDGTVRWVRVETMFVPDATYDAL